MSSFTRVAGLKPGRNFFNLSYTKKFNGDMGKLYPVMCDEVVPGDIFKIGNDVVCRFEPMIAPIMQDVWFKVRYFFVPYRLMKRDCLSGEGVEPGDTFDWEEFISDGVDGKTVTQVLPRWIPTNNAKYSLWDYLGFPVGVSPAGAYPLNFPREAYNFIWNEYFRNENLDNEVSLDNEDILNVRWNKDYFTSALPWQQRGVAPVMSGDIMYLGYDDQYHKVNISRLVADFGENVVEGSDGVYGPTGLVNDRYGDYTSILGVEYQNVPRLGAVFESVKKSDGSHFAYVTAPGVYEDDTVNRVGRITSLGGDLHQLVSGLVYPKDGSTSIVYGGFNVAQLRLCIQTQKWLERNARAGARYTELLRAHWGVAPTDARLDRPEYIGGSKTPIIISEVLQTSSTDATSPQGSMAGHGITVDRNYVAKYRVPEYGLIMGLAYVVPKHEYASQGINRQWLRRAKLDFPWPEFMHLSEQGIETAEIYATNTESDNVSIFGFIGCKDEMRHKQSMLCADFRDNYQDWTLNEFYANKPLLNSSFVECNPRKNIFAVQTYPCMKINFGNVIHAYRPIPLIGEPGLADHF